MQASHNSWFRRSIARATRFFTVKGRSIVIASLLTTGLLSAAKPFGILEPLELFSFDYLTRLQSDEPPDPQILIVGLTEADIQQHGWPLSDRVLAQLLANLQQHRPSVIGLDLYRSTLRPPGSDELMAQLQADNLVTIMNVGNDHEVAEVPPPPSVPWERVGFNDLIIDNDGILRRSLLFVSAADKPYYSFALRVALAHLSDRQLDFQYDAYALTIGDTRFWALNHGSGGYQAIDDRGYQIVLRYRNRSLPAQLISMSQALSGDLDPDWIRDKVVLIGTVAPSLKDQFYNPFSAARVAELTMSGVVIHAQIISQLVEAINGGSVLYQYWPQWGETLWLLGWTLITGTIVWYLKRPLWLVGAGGVMLLGLWGVGWWSLSQLVWIPIAEPMIGVLIAGGLSILHKLLYRSTHDWLTGLPTRELFVQYLRQAVYANRPQKTNLPVIVVFLDIDRFKLINQSLGHGAGDRVLVTIAHRLRSLVPQSVKVARVGGDEFSLLFQRMPRATVESILDSLQQTISEPIYLDQQQFHITASFGIAIVQDNFEHKPEDLMRDALTAMYRAKTLGRSRYEVFSTGMLVEAVNRLRLENDLLNAIRNEEFTLFYQPIVHLDTGKVAGFEALVRWEKSSQEFIPPCDFIPIAEETGYITVLGEWIFKEACYQLKAWQQQFPDYSLKMSINLSKQQLEQSGLVKQFETILKTINLSASSIQLEITESTAMVDVEAAVELMLRLKRSGLQFSIDDFGTGYSSLSYLHRLPIDTLKIDKSFVGRMEQSSEDWEIVQTIITLGHKLGMSIVAEGIESAVQVEALKRNQCEYGQGYFFSRPLSAETATEFLEQLYPTGTIAIDASQE